MQICPESESPALSSRFAAAVLLIALGISGIASGQPADPDLVINEFFYRGADSDLEYVEIFNRSAHPVDLRTVALSDNRRNLVRVTESPRILPSGGYTVVVRNAAVFDRSFDFSDRLEPSAWSALNNSGDSVILWENGIVIDSVAYTASWGGDDVALERLDPSAPSGIRNNWAESIERGGGTPGRINSVYAPDRQPPGVVFCEEIEPGRLSVSFSEPIDPNSINPSAFSLDIGPPPLFLAIDRTREVVQLDLLTGSDAASTLTVAGLSDGSGNTLDRVSIDIAWLPVEGELVLNEIMYEPLADDFDTLPDQPEYVEIVSSTTRIVSLRSLTLTDRLREDGTRDTTSLGGRRIALESGGSVLIHSRVDPTQGPLDAFPATDRSQSDLVIIPIDAATLSLGNNGDQIRLEGRAGVIDDVEYDPSWHLPELVESRGVSLERISTAGLSQDPTNWSSSVDPSGGTPGLPNSIRYEHPAKKVDRRITIDPAPFSPDGDGFEDFTSIEVDLSNPTAVLRVWIFDLSGAAVRELEVGRPVSSTSSLIWDGRDDSGELLDPGLYIVLVEAVDTASGFVDRMKAPVPMVR